MIDKLTTPFDGARLSVTLCPSVRGDPPPGYAKTVSYGVHVFCDPGLGNEDFTQGQRRPTTAKRRLSDPGAGVTLREPERWVH